MKNLLKINLMAVLVLVFCTMGAAQDKQDKQQRMSREQLAEKQAKHIAQELAFDEATTQKFLETYSSYLQEVWALKTERQAEPTNDEDAKQAIKARFERRHAILNLQEKYYKEYSKFLTDSQIEQVYKSEHKVMNHLNKHRGHNHNGRKGH